MFESQNGKIDENEVQVPTQNNVCAHTHTHTHTIYIYIYNTYSMKY